MFSKACEYGIKATIHIAKETNNGNRCSLKGIAGAIASPEAFTAKILQSLAKNQLITSIKGANGGYVLDTKKQKQVHLLQIVNAIDGDKIYSGCALGLHQCNEENPCPIHHEFKAIRTDLKNMLEKTSIHQLTISLTKELTFLKN